MRITWTDSGLVGEHDNSRYNSQNNTTKATNKLYFHHPRIDQEDEEVNEERGALLMAYNLAKHKHHPHFLNSHVDNAAGVVVVVAVVDSVVDFGGFVEDFVEDFVDVGSNNKKKDYNYHKVVVRVKMMKMMKMMNIWVKEIYVYVYDDDDDVGGFVVGILLGVVYDNFLIEEAHN